MTVYTEAVHHATDEQFRIAACEAWVWGSDDELTVDNDARVVRTDPGAIAQGAWIEAWVFVRNEDTG